MPFSILYALRCEVGHVLFGLLWSLPALVPLLTLTTRYSFFSTSGNATVSRRCAEMGNEMAAELKSRRIDAVIFTST